MIEHAAGSGEAERRALEWVVAAVAELVELPAETVAPTRDPMDLGVDSVRLLTLVERAQQAGYEVEFADFLDGQSLAEWAGLLAEARRRSG